VAAPTCPYCGAPVAAGASFCGHCGRSLAAVPAPPPPLFANPPPTQAPPGYAVPGYLAPGYSPPGYAPPGGPPTGAVPRYAAYPSYPGFPGGPSALRADIDGPVLSDIFTAGALLLIGVVLSLIGPDLIGTGLGPAVSFSANSSSGFSASALTDLLIVLVAGLALTILAYIKFRQAFARLRGVDTQFRTPATLCLLAIIGLILLLPTLVALLEIATALVNCAGTSGVVPQSCLNSTGELLGVAGLLLIAGVLALIGYIGTLVGIWRFGNRYNETMFRIGAILLIIPYLNAIGAILLMIGAHGAKGRLPGSPGGLPPTAPYRPF
jgi:hypothetical protein